MPSGFFAAAYAVISDWLFVVSECLGVAMIDATSPGGQSA
jgi:hypothetical protein